ncbi:MAG TPA: autotransporter domain-containing protein [Bradyrhizobium sp.]|uniref:autotransporter domain-containing protein n=1 Tax=Bradyrhizobium sp. TaxID=376 RepID=UPI002B608B38|nr:autotransporter domain-containing protein [Bradyrhizobium sp.]HLZ05780.1 autotransporter domain-containing protein [Bradyrhizobium sp.]
MLPDSWTFTGNAQSYTITGNPVSFSLGGSTGGVINNANAAQTITISANINDGGGGAIGVQQLGNSTLVLSGTNGYSGGTLISAGTVQVTNANSVGSGAVTLNGGTFQMQHPTVTTVAFTNNLTVNVAGGTVDTAGAQVNLQGVIADGAGSGVLRLTDSLGTGSVQLSGVNTYSGGTLVNGTTAIVTNNSSFGKGTVTLDQGLLQAGASNLTLANNFRINHSAIGSSIDAAGKILTIAGNISDGSGPGQLTVQDSFGGGKVVLLGNNTYTGGTTICLCGTLELGDATHTASLVGAIENEGAFGVFNANTSGITSLTNDGGVTTFFNSTSAAAMTINNVFGGRTIFDDTSTAGQARIVNTNSGVTQFGRSGGSDTSTAGNASIDNSFGGGVFFRADSTAGNATITNHDSGGIDFQDHASGASATIVNNSGGSTAFFDFSTAGNANIVTNNGGQLGFFNHSDAGSAIITVNSGGFAEFANNANGGNAQFITNGTGYVDFGEGVGPNGDNRITAGSIAGSGLYYIGGGHTLAVGGNNLSTTVSGVIADNNPCGCTTGSGVLEKDGSGALTLSGANTYSGGTLLSAGTLIIGNNSALGSGTLTMAAATTLSFLNTGNFTLANAIKVSGDPNFAPPSGTTQTLSGVISDGASPGVVNVQGPGTLVLAGANTYSGGTIVSGGTLQLTGAGTLGAAIGTATVSAGTLDLGGTTQTLAALNLAGGTLQNGKLNAPIASAGGVINGIGGAASLTTTAGTTFVLGTNTYTGPTTVNGGILDVIGSIIDPTVNSGGLLMGTGTVGSTQVNAGGIFAPGVGFGTSMTVQGNLAFQSAALYLVQVNATTSTFANVTGTASLAGTVGVAFDPSASFVKKQYVILQAAGGVSGAFSGVGATPGGLIGTVTYDPTHAYLNFDLNYGAKNNLNTNQQNVANTLSNFFNANGGIATVFASLTPAGLSQASGETATGIQQATFNAVNMFLQLLTDPFVSGRSGGVTANSGAQPYAEEDDALAYAARKSGSARAALAKIPTKAEVARNDLLDNRWSVWGSAFGGGANISGNAAVGSNSADVSAFGFAAGADYRISPATLAGFALAGGGTNFSVANSGSGRSDMFQAGAFVRHRMGAAYVTGALAYGGQEVTTDRTVTIAGLDHLQAQFNANSWSGRLEGGYRTVTPWMGITPYAAAQFTTIDLPSYAEQVVAGAGNFALNYNAKDVTDARTELGVRTDKSWAEPNGILGLRGRLAWAHDFNTDRSAAAVFQSLPGTFFVVNGAAVAHDSALTTVSLERTWLNGWSAAATFDGEFSDVLNSYAGKAVIRYAW